MFVRERLLVICWLILSPTCVGLVAGNEMNQHPVSDEIHLRSKRNVNTTDTSYFYYEQANYQRDCQEISVDCNSPTDGVYLIKPDGYPEPFEVFCNNTIQNGGWTVFQRRIYGDVEFHRNWNDYKNGFGFIHRDYWLGNDKLAYLTNQKDYELRVDFVSSSGESRFAIYNLFRISDEAGNYKLIGLGNYSGSAGYDSLFQGPVPNYGLIQFSTYDRDNENSGFDCAELHRGGWWFHYSLLDTQCFSWRSGTSNHTCGNSNLNGNFGESGAHSIYWRGLPGSYCDVRYSEMKIRPI